MPLYTYECSVCGVRFDARQKFSDDPIAICPECGSSVHRVPQPVGIVFKGSGWYVNDSRGHNSLAVPPKKDEPAVSEAPAKDTDSKSSASTPDTPSSAPSDD